MAMMGFAVGCNSNTDNKRIAINLSINSDISVEDAIDLINVYLKTAEETDKEDTTADSLIVEKALDKKNNTPGGEEAESIVMTLENTKIEAQVPEDFYYEPAMDYYDKETKILSSKRFTAADTTSVDLYLYAVYGPDEITAHRLLKAQGLVLREGSEKMKSGI
ncbi:MAG: hypothetical protein K6E98_06045 [Lachnospiraceae bacterium]|nr:hypothetical protein [Lachnospiraceae bacterium]